MRKFRYRIWYKGQMLYPPNPFDSMTTCRTSNGENTEITPHLHLDGRWYINGEFQKYKLMQFTGLLDKNGKEIYEGDIMCDQYGPFEIKWGIFGWYPFEYNGGSEVSPEKYEVIGNIYENSELLNNK